MSFVTVLNLLFRDIGIGPLAMMDNHLPLLLTLLIRCHGTDDANGSLLGPVLEENF
jgi:hypothetical protein